LAVSQGPLFPHCRRWWMFLAAGCGLQRILALRHYPSDVLVGAGVGLIVGTVVTRRFFKAMENSTSSTTLKLHVIDSDDVYRHAA
ncbi:MAG: phosphatase PAP2 family protein, partial [Planctomyces sp.]